MIIIERVLQVIVGLEIGVVMALTAIAWGLV